MKKPRNIGLCEEIITYGINDRQLRQLYLQCSTVL